MRLTVLLLAALCLSACSFVGFPGVYKINVEQGNIVTPEMVGQLQPGMSRRQVRFILGSPLIEHSFDRDRWDYSYRLSNGLDILDEWRFSVIFDGDALVEVRGDYVPVAFGGEPPPEMAPEEVEPDAG